MVFTPIIIVTGVGAFFGVILGIASKKFAVHVDPRIEAIDETLPGANCGACGYPGCSAFAKAVAEGKADPTGCIVGGTNTADKIASIMNIEVSQQESYMAVVHCKGGNKETSDRAFYEGIQDCHAAVLTGNGPKECQYGCLGLGSCVRACPFDAIHINNNGVAEVIADKCTGCGKCVTACPRHIIELIPRHGKIFLGCSNHERGAKVKKYCSVGCTACTLCTKAVRDDAIIMKENSPFLDYSKDENFVAAKHKCPQHCFVDLAKARPRANIDTTCDGCGKCVEVCPVKDAITGEQGSRHMVNKQKCIGCGLCLSVCPRHAISFMGVGANKRDYGRSSRVRS